MTNEFTKKEADRHNALTSKGWALTEGRIVLQDIEPNAPPGFVSRWQLRRAIRCFTKALAIHPDGWSSMFALGKIYQRLGDHDVALQWFMKAHEIKPDQVDVAREGGLAALDSGQIEKALDLCQAAATARPNDAGLVCNLALAHCLSGQDSDAKRRADEAVQLDPNDSICARVRDFVAEVETGRRPRPKRLIEAFAYH